MAHRATMMKVLSPVEGKNGKTFWIRIGNAFVNRDGSTNVYLNAYPTSGKLQIRELEERDHSSYTESSRGPFEDRANGHGSHGNHGSHGDPAGQGDLPF